MVGKDGGDEQIELAGPDETEPLGNKLETWWEAEKLKSTNNPSLFCALVKTFYSSSIYYGILIAVQCLFFCLVPPVLSRELIYRIKYQEAVTKDRGLIMAGLIVGSLVVNVLFFHHTLLHCQRIGNRSKVACASLIYRKILKLNVFVLRQLSIKDILHLLMYETDILESSSVYVHYLWVVPLQVLGAGLLLYDIGGFSALLGLIFFIVVATPIHCLIAIKYQHTRQICHEYIRMRCLHLSELATNMRSVKSFCYEKYFHDKIMDYRRKEFELIKKSLYLQATQILVTYLSSRIAFFITISTAQFFKRKLESEWVFPVFQLFDVLQLYAAIRFPNAVSRFHQLRKSLRKIKAFLLLPDSIQVHADIPAKGTKMGSVQITNVTADWDTEKKYTPTSKHTLKDINLEIQPGSLIVIIGAKGSGKSSLLNLLINEIPVIRGKVQKLGRLSYSSQEPWLFTSTIKRNIIFGEAPHRALYKTVLQVCDVISDLKGYPLGDKSIVYQQVFLDDAQKAKINLARSVYRDADIYVFDEPYAALDPPLAKYIFNESCMKHLAGKTRILATKHSSFLKDADMIVILEDGHIKAKGTLDELPLADIPAMKTFSKAARKSEGSEMSLASIYDDYESIHEIKHKASKKSMYKRYHLGFITKNQLTFVILFTVLCQIGFTACSFWLMHWVYKEDHCFGPSSVFKPELFHTEISNTTIFKREILVSELGVPKKVAQCKVKEGTSQTFTYYLVITGTIAVTVVLAMIKFYYLCQQHIKATNHLHNTAFKNILRARTEFFKTRNVETIIENFSHDLLVVDEKICRQLIESLHVSSLMLGTILLLCILFPIMIFVSIITLVILIFLRRMFMKAAHFYYTSWSKERYPIEYHIKGTLEGLKTIRCYNANYLITKEMDELLNSRTSPYVTLIFLDHMFGFYADIICVIYVSLAIFQAFFVPSFITLTGSGLGMGLTEVYTLIVYLQSNMKQSIKFSYSIFSKSYLETYKHLETEIHFVRDNDEKYLKFWPSEGKIEFVDVSMPNLENSTEEITNFDLKISGGDKVAIVGRRGSGKFCIVSLLFYFNEFYGKIYIDGVELRQIGLTILRNSITLLSTTGFIFSDTVSKNLDPYNFYDTAVLESAMEKVKLSDILPLDKEIRERLITIEQKFLISLARVIISNKKIIVKEETSNILEPRTRTLINQLMETEFKDNTVIFLTNKKEEIILTNTTVVLEDGKIVEFGETNNLLKNEKSKLNNILDVKEGDEGGETLKEPSIDDADSDLDD